MSGYVNKGRIDRFILIAEEPDTMQEFLARITVVDGCWIMQGGAKYPNFKNVHGHIASWILNYGPFEEGKLVLHTCDIESCVNPHHLYLGTRSDNAKDAYDRGQLRQEKALEGEILERAKYAYIEMNMTQKQIASLFKVGTASVGRALNGMKRGRYTKRNKK